MLTAVQGEGQPGHRAWWTNWLDTRTLVALSATVIATVASVALYTSRPVAPVPGSPVASAAVESSVLADTSLDPLVGTGVENDEWAFVASVMGTLEGDDMHEVLAPSHDAVDTAIEALTSDQRDRFMKLLKAEMSEGLE